jgi:hypothetical protein
MKRSWPWLLLILVSLALVFGWPRQEPTEEQLIALREERRLEERAKMWREDFKACDRFASRRDDARKLLALDPEAESKKTPEEKLADSTNALKNLDVQLNATARLWEADRRACLRGEGWKDEWIDELEAKDRERASRKATGSKKALPDSTR